MLCVFPVCDELRSLQFRCLMAGGIKRKNIVCKGPSKSTALKHYATLDFRADTSFALYLDLTMVCSNMLFCLRSNDLNCLQLSYWRNCHCCLRNFSHLAMKERFFKATTVLTSGLNLFFLEIPMDSFAYYNSLLSLLESGNSDFS